MQYSCLVTYAKDRDGKTFEFDSRVVDPGTDATGNLRADMAREVQEFGFDEYNIVLETYEEF